MAIICDINGDIWNMCTVVLRWIRINNMSTRILVELDIYIYIYGNGTWIPIADDVVRIFYGQNWEESDDITI